ncbi:hypothetical protein CISIN_1g034151mg [Citrus sinensis]|uniref:R13L1/DRL21-like LRR repeat region domain-containing protein n=1 Tax=Citrus sinensis TaxID=2711 RepID=A0A067D9Q0_CITSI|nr:hypothetical protein CISIN_1g034151mg [Citrus sinensis]KDO38281.1 hypothetical protein CISIN_1g034151mg [Citrus sinensis]KDO38282.1 hypothetical protein CISIN_1g034151mg [Citrus sinensis]
MSSHVHARRDCEINKSPDIGRVPLSGGSADGGKACGISRLGKVLDVGEATRLELNQLKYLLRLRLKFDGEEGEEEVRRKNVDDQRVLEALQPPLTLKELELL